MRRSIRRIILAVAAVATVMGFGTAPEAKAVCVGDCGSDGVTLRDVQRSVNIFLNDLNLSACPEADGLVRDGTVDRDEALAAAQSYVLGPTRCQQIAALPTPTATPEVQPGLGLRDFTIWNPSGNPVGSKTVRTGFFTSALGGGNVAANFTVGPLKLRAGAPDQNGVAPLTLAEPAIFGYAIPPSANQVLCWRLQPAEQGGFIACNGGRAVDTILTEQGGQTPPPAEFLTEQGTAGPAGSAMLWVWRQITDTQPAGTDCTTVNFDQAAGPPVLTVLTTGKAKVTKGSKQLEMSGEPFDCGQWTVSDGLGMLVNTFTGFDSRAGGDVANALRIADRP